MNLNDLQGKDLQLNDFEGKTGQNQVALNLQHFPMDTDFTNLQSSQKREVKKAMKVN
jgi:hypothetical protein